MESRYLVTKETFAYRFCHHCGGSGTTTHTFQKQKIRNTCPVCNGAGRQKVTHRTEVTLEEAIQNIQNSRL